MQYFYKNNNSQDLIVFFAGWGCDENQFTNLNDTKDVLILYNYQDLNLHFDFSKYKNIYIIAYSAGVFVASVFENQIPNIRQKIAVCGNPYLFDETFGISKENIKVFKNITLDNYYEQFKNKIHPAFDKAIVAENDLIFNLEAQKDFYQNKLQIIKNAKHHIFFHFNSFEDML